MSGHTISLYKDGDEFRVRVDAPGERAVSAPIRDPFGFCAQIAQQAGLGVAVDTRRGVLHISRKPEDLDTTASPDADPGAFDSGVDWLEAEVVDPEPLPDWFRGRLDPDDPTIDE